MFSFYQIHPTSINKTNGGPSSEDGVTNKVSETTRSLFAYHRSHLSLGAKILCKLCLTVPPRGTISSFLVLLSTLGILTVLSATACHQLCLLRNQPIMQASEGAIFGASKGAMLGTSEGANNVIVNKGDTTAIFGVSEGASDPSPCSLHSFTTSFADVESDQLNTQTHFDSASIFFVCDNSTTGHICIDIQKFIPCTL
jgi:hypothetical protein